MRSSLRTSEITVGASPIDFSGNPGPQLPGAVKDDLTFEFRTWPSVGRLRVSGLPTAWTVKSMRVNGVDASDKPIDFVAGTDVVGIEIELIGPRAALTALPTPWLHSTAPLHAAWRDSLPARSEG